VHHDNNHGFRGVALGGFGAESAVVGCGQRLEICWGVSEDLGWVCWVREGVQQTWKYGPVGDLGFAWFGGGLCHGVDGAVG